MELACTKKLLEYIGVKPEKMPIEVDPLFEWTANLLVINRRKTIVVVHAASRCSFVLHGMTVKHLKKLPHCILAVGDAPMEDCGGPEGFAHVMEVLQDKNHPEHREISEWVRSTWWQPLDVKRINFFLKNAHRKRAPIIY